MPDAPDDSPRPLRSGRYFTEAELAAAAERARVRAGLTQTALAERLGVRQHTLSAALNYANPANRTRGHELRRRILAELDGLEIAGPYWLPMEPGSVRPGFDPHRPAGATADVPPETDSAG